MLSEIETDKITTEVVALRASCLANERGAGACAVLLARMPQINPPIIGEVIMSWDKVNIGLAVALKDGLVVPVIKDADLV